MFEIKNNRLIIAGISVRLPNGLYLTTHPVFENENTLIFTDKEQSFYMEVQEQEYTGPLDKVLKEEILPSVYTVLSEIQPITINGLTGFYMIYEDKKQVYFEMKLQDRDKLQNLHLDILITVIKNYAIIQNIINSKEIQNFLIGLGSICCNDL